MKACTTILFTFLFSLTTLAQSHYPLKNLLGVNVHPWDLVGAEYEQNRDTVTKRLQNAIKSTGFNWIRLYLDASAAKDPQNITYILNPQGNGYRIDDAIAAIRAGLPNFKVNVCYQNQPKNIMAEWSGAHSTVYRHRTSDIGNPASYSELAHDCAVLTARGGTNTSVQNYPVYVGAWWEPLQIMYKGAGFYNQIEAGNEWDNPWSNDQPLNGAQYAAAWKTVYDSVKKTDPNMLVSSTGVMTAETNVLTDALNYAASQGWGKVFDKYQFHLYPWGWSKDIASAMPPEIEMIPMAKNVVAAAKGAPAVVGEWGYDLNEQSWIGVTPFSNYKGEQVRAYWVARTLLGFARAGIESAFYYRIYQDYGLLQDSNSTIFETSSLFEKDASVNIRRRLSGDVFKQMLQFGDYVFDAAIIENDTTRVYRFKKGTNYLYAGWTIEGVQLVNKWNSNRAAFTERKVNYVFPAGTQYTIAEDSSDNMKAQPYYGTTVTLSSKPVFVVTNTILPIKDKPAPLPHTPTPQWYHAEVYDYLGRLLSRAYINNQNTFEKSLPRGKQFIVKYFNEKTFATKQVFNP